MNLPPCACGASDYLLAYEGTYLRGLEPYYSFALHKCRRCALVRTSPVPGVDLCTARHVIFSTLRTISQLPRLMSHLTSLVRTYAPSSGNI